MMGPALLDLYSTSLGSSNGRKKKPDSVEAKESPLPLDQRPLLSDAENSNSDQRPPTKQRSLPLSGFVRTSGSSGMTGLFRKASPRDSSTKSLPGLRSLLFADTTISSTGSAIPTSSSNVSSNDILVNIREEDEHRPDSRSTSVLSSSKHASEFQKSSSDGCKVRGLLTVDSSLSSNSTSMQHLGAINTGSSSTAQLITRCSAWYVGELPLEPLQTMAMLPWMVAEFRRIAAWPRLWSDRSASNSLTSSLSFGSMSSLTSSSGPGRNGPVERRPITLELTDRFLRALDRKSSGDTSEARSFVQMFSARSTSCSDYGSLSGTTGNLNSATLIGSDSPVFVHLLPDISKVQLIPISDDEECNLSVCFVYLLKQPNTRKAFTVHVFETDDQHFVSSPNCLFVYASFDSFSSKNAFQVFAHAI